MGFTFNDIHSDIYSLNLLTVDRPLLPSLKKRMLEIPGRHGVYDFGGNTYENVIISLVCFYEGTSYIEARQKLRLIAGWLQTKSQLKFDDEPEKYYYGRLYNVSEIEPITNHAKISLSFECEPFAYSQIQTEEVTRTDNTSLFIFNNGTIETPAEYTITNTGADPLTNIRVKLIKKL